MHIKTVILLGNFSLGLINFVNNNVFIQRYSFLTFFILGVNDFLHLWLQVGHLCTVTIQETLP